MNPHRDTTEKRRRFEIISGGSSKKITEYERHVRRIARLMAAGFDTRAYALAFRMLGGKR